ncbi:PAS domain-containing sensor histidine kinase [Pseudomonas sp. NFR16]|uniref:hybrid sensor histidine kinase/response regulator n=1 Tax=Pseudomonas sp. NFR16 TaxID=1566248 RepID=UPI0008B2F5FA|nr:PAS domain-containing sensor histidine kinase [Pseudomonas sp. NFR16]SEI55637.1 PAS/PAC sensor hybrid histidine kinase [Pseudomonas sp. NFR16]
MQPAESSQGLLTQDNRYRLLVDAVIDYAIYMIDTDGIVRSWNSGARRIKQYEEAEIVGRSFSLFYTEEDRLAGMPGRALQIAATSGRFEGEGWRVRKDGTRLWALVVIDPIHAPDGTLIGYAKVTRDLTERRLAQEALRNSERQFSLLVQGVTDYALYMLDPTGIITTWNAGAERIKGYSPAEVIGQHYSLFFEPVDADAGRPQHALLTARSEGRFEGQGWRLRKDGTRFLAHVVIDPIRDDDGQFIGFAKITRDITEAVQAQTTLKETREALYQSQKMESIGQLTGGIAHDFNNLLTVILGSLGIVKKRLVDDPKSASLLDNAMAAAQRGSSLTQRMLAFARRQELTPRAVDVGNLIRGMSELLGTSLGANIAVETRFPLRLKPVFVDAGQLEMAIMNLMINARDAMPDGGSVVVSAKEVSLPRVAGAMRLEEFVCISVSDTGSGMDDATLQRAMEPFFTTKGLGKGTGLGLSMVHGLAAQSGGKLVLSSTAGKGTTAELWLPVSVATPEQSVPLNEGASDGEARSMPLKVLFVDDDPLVLMSTKAMIEDLGHQVVTANSGDEALTVISDHVDVDLVITDHIMPSMTGTELARHIARLDPALPVIIASGFTDNPTLTTVTTQRLPKPFNQLELARAIASISRS